MILYCLCLCACMCWGGMCVCGVLHTKMISISRALLILLR